MRYISHEVQKWARTGKFSSANNGYSIMQILRWLLQAAKNVAALKVAAKAAKSVKSSLNFNCFGHNNLWDHPHYRCAR